MDETSPGPISVTPGSAASLKRPGITVRRKPPEAGQILQDALSINDHPTKAERALILQKIHSLGHTWYSDHNVYNWFSRRKSETRVESNETSERKPTKLTIKIPSMLTATDAPQRSSTFASLNDTPGGRDVAPTRRTRPRLRHYPPIKHSAVWHLTVLAESSPNPSAEVISTWAKLIKADPEDVRKWTGAFQAMSRSEYGTDLSDDASLLTAANISGTIAAEGSESEEEHLAGSAVHIRTVSSVSATVNSVATVRSTPNSATNYPLPATGIYKVPPQDKLLLAIHKGVFSSTLDERPSLKSAADFDDLFAPYNTMLRKITEDLETGRLGRVFGF